MPKLLYNTLEQHVHKWFCQLAESTGFFWKGVVVKEYLLYTNSMLMRAPVLFLVLESNNLSLSIVKNVVQFQMQHVERILKLYLILYKLKRKLVKLSI